LHCSNPRIESRNSIPRADGATPNEYPAQEVLTMAEIKIERKKGVPMWALLLGLVLLVLLVWAVLTMRNDDSRQAPQDVAVLAWSVPSAADLHVELNETVPALARCA
jgi:hypothetical protein